MDLIKVNTLKEAIALQAVLSDSVIILGDMRQFWLCSYEVAAELESAGYMAL
jgi:hypothetical protein